MSIPSVFFVVGYHAQDHAKEKSPLRKDYNRCLRKVDQNLDPLMAEVMSLRWGLILARDLCFRELEPETDCFEVVQVLHQTRSESTFFDLQNRYVLLLKVHFTLFVILAMFVERVIRLPMIQQNWLLLLMTLFGLRKLLKSLEILLFMISWLAQLNKFGP